MNDSVYGKIIKERNIPWLRKDEIKGKIISEYVGLKPKMW